MSFDFFPVMNLHTEHRSYSIFRVDPRGLALFLYTFFRTILLFLKRQLFTVHSFLEALKVAYFVRSRPFVLLILILFFNHVSQSKTMSEFLVSNPSPFFLNFLALL